ncbi:hypothetical protein [Comamonas squillarum]|uniref:Winged helix-turn-helix domain-containing protein n=1 Tax=Comamonas squillarum TaxID=2977320 RepID=A0ABY6A544_9BURK|nr:hypothetical protein [Comamonas sp. PR12]UXC20162.1 hypothetical protein N4T19_08655 [Comamonas sp. PR12]
MNNTRAYDPVSSHCAAEHSARFADRHVSRIMAALQDEKSLTAGEMAECTGMTVEQICRRLPELERRGHTQVVQFEGADLLRNGYRVWEAV